MSRTGRIDFADILVAVSILGVLAAIAMPALVQSWITLAGWVGR